MTPTSTNSEEESARFLVRWYFCLASALSGEIVAALSLEEHKAWRHNFICRMSEESKVMRKSTGKLVTALLRLLC